MPAIHSSRETASADDDMVIMPLGGGQEVGRSCILLQYKKRNLLLDCGCHPGRQGADSLPFFDALDNPEDIDLILVTHFHIDHCAALPYFTEKTSFNGEIYMTHATKAVMRLLLEDNIRLQSGSSLYDQRDLENCMEKIKVIDFHQTIEYKGIKFTATAAGHVLGAAMFTLDIDNVRILYTGDYSFEEDRHLSKADIPPGNAPDVLIVESTFGTTNIEKRELREKRFVSAVENIVSGGGSCLIPVFALGRAQELLLILEEFWRENPKFQRVPIYFASHLAEKSLKVYQTFVNMMNTNVRKMNDRFQNPFKLKYIRSDAVDDSKLTTFGSSVVMASPGFMQSGTSRTLFEAWCEDPKNGVIIAGYTIEGTLANDLLKMPDQIQCLRSNVIKQRRCSIEVCTFSAHVDFQQNKDFISLVKPDYIVLVHGEKNNMNKLKDRLEVDFKAASSKGQHEAIIATPENGRKLRFKFQKNIIANIVGQSAVEILDSTQNIDKSLYENVKNPKVSLPSNSVLVTENFATKLVTKDELSQFTNCKFGNILEKFTIPIPNDIVTIFQANNLQSSEHVMEMIVDHIQQVYDEVVITSSNVILVEDLVTISLLPGAFSYSFSGLTIEWKASPLSDLIADGIAGMLTQFFSAGQLVKLTLSGLQQGNFLGKKKLHALKSTHDFFKKRKEEGEEEEEGLNGEEGEEFEEEFDEINS